MHSAQFLYRLFLTTQSDLDTTRWSGVVDSEKTPRITEVPVFLLQPETIGLVLIVSGLRVLICSLVYL